MDMRLGVLAVAAAALVSGWAPAASPAATVVVDGQDTPVYDHGGGCRKSSPPGQCCHMEKATGRVHCH
ncbi:hypothetical protein [Roseovarius autotrophicus]|uniref:hypothetical protein n=1 Tax=Roseovarius autotrophicus TaxID=2824121 RepID=UPI001A08606A|nr:hypothetical protein [Roseovarius autotrophicus]MBE0452208.1 hypothetical protein [Roseovarius sp.]